MLSATGAFNNLATLAPSTGLIPFTVNSPLWSDGAIKTRWVAVPNDGLPYTSDEQISFLPVGEWTFPNGTVFVKHFELTVNEITGERKRLETRLLVRNQTGSVYGVTYKWRPDNSDADLLPGALGGRHCHHHQFRRFAHPDDRVIRAAANAWSATIARQTMSWG